eukprot:6174160-Pleurochrysis_carterae.AAC.2
MDATRKRKRTHSDIETDIERQEGKREVEKFVHGLRNGEIVGGPARERRMRHATRKGDRPSFWTYLKANTQQEKEINRLFGPISRLTVVEVAGDKRKKKRYTTY